MVEQASGTRLASRTVGWLKGLCFNTVVTRQCQCGMSGITCPYYAAPVVDCGTVLRTRMVCNYAGW